VQPFLTYRPLNALMQTLRHVSRAFRCAVCALLHVLRSVVSVHVGIATAASS
jgi:hypothetical protein